MFFFRLGSPEFRFSFEFSDYNITVGNRIGAIWRSEDVAHNENNMVSGSKFNFGTIKRLLNISLSSNWSDDEAMDFCFP